VEHPITEYITGIDLVEEMIRVAAGHPLKLKQQDVPLKGWAIESRVYAEDPEKYLPSIGTLRKYQEPRAETDLQEVRVDSGIVEGSEISIHYDPMISKLCTYGRDRNEAIQNMRRALDTYVIQGVTHNIPLLRDIIDQPDFQSGKLSTNFLAEHYPQGFRGQKLTPTTQHELVTTAALGHAIREIRNSTLSQPASRQSLGPHSVYYPTQTEWQAQVKLPVSAAESEAPAPIPVKVALVDKTFSLTEPNIFEVQVNGESTQRVTVDWPVESPVIKTTTSLADGSSSQEVIVQYIDSLPLGLRLQHHGTHFDVQVLSATQSHLSKYMKEKAPLDLSKVVLSPMPGRVVSINVKVGDVIAEGGELAVVEAMKMQNVLRAPKAGTIKAVHVAANDTVNADEIIIELED
ncbi:hypothetical protein IWQ62_001535, partial [Dispira parvispora]